MTTLPRYSGMRDILRQLEDVWALRRSLRLWKCLLAGTAVLAGCVLFAALALGYWPDQPPTALRWAVLALSVAAISTAAGLACRAFAWKQNYAQNARFVESHLPELHNDLINSVLLSGDADQSSPELVQLAIYETLLRSRNVDVRKSVPRRTLSRWAAVAAGAIVLLGGFAAFQPGPLKRGLMGAILPGAYVERVNRIELTGLSPADGTTCFVGEPVDIVAVIKNEPGEPFEGEVVFRDLPPRPLTASRDGRTFMLTGQTFEQSFEYAVRIGDSRWPTDKPYYRVNVLPRVKIEGLDLRYEYPAYTKLKTREVRNAAGAIEAPIGTRVTVTLRTGTPVRAVSLERQSGARLPMTPKAERMSFSVVLDVLDNDGYRVVVEDTRQQLPDGEGLRGAAGFAAGQDAALAGYFPIRAEADAPPKIEFVKPNRDVDLAPGAKLETMIRVYDKYGLTDARLFAGKQGTEPREVRDFALAVAGQTKADIRYDLEMPAGTAKGDVIVYYATVTDNRSLPKIAGPQTTASQRFKVTVQDAAEVAAAKAKKYDELRDRLMAILKIQEVAHVDAGICWREHKELADVLKTARTVLDAQKRIRADLIGLADTFDFGQEMVTVQQAVAMLAGNEARTAVDQASVVAQLASLEGRNQSCELLWGTQEQVLDALRTLLAIMPSLAGEKHKDKGSRAADLPPDAREKLKALDEKLAQFLEDQKKVIEATERLNKKPVDNLTAEDEELLKDLIATEDKWEKFMEEAFADFSRLVEQDFANPAMLKELMAVKSDITMAKDALSKKATEIATAAEDGALGGGEEIVSNIEKWLPDEPDRTKWAMESMPDDQGNIEMPELAKEMEDLVGDLLEEEEDLFDEMEDLSARAAFSGSDAIGWDAMDGPISNMGAQGVTGNQLPNNNELQGRSGQGRSGKSSGEFVGDTAEDKGGRRTPTRVTPEPFQKGQVDDQSTESPGGATGGGKLSGSGAEGLEGPVPPDIAKEMPRLAQKQAAIVNKAERLRGGFEVNDYAGFKFLQAITLMNRVQRDLEKGRYRNVLRARARTISALKQSQVRLGQIDVARDASAGMPKYIRDDIHDAMNGKLPAEFEDVLKVYYRRLSESGAGGGAGGERPGAGTSR